MCANNQEGFGHCLVHEGRPYLCNELRSIHTTTVNLLWLLLWTYTAVNMLMSVVAVHMSDKLVHLVVKVNWSRLCQTHVILTRHAARTDIVPRR